MRPLKSRGQNFLVQQRLAERIVDRAAPNDGDHVIEIGPGLGMLTEVLAQNPIAHLTLIELDPRLAMDLQDRLGNDPRISVINDDFLRVDLNSMAGEGSVKIVGNLPFNVASAILERLCDYQALITRMVLMFQREVGERIRAQSGMRDHCALSVFTALYWRVTEHFRVAAGSFYPRPKIDGEVLVFEPNKEPRFAPNEEEAIKATIRAGFSAPRKTIRNALTGGLSIAPAIAERALTIAHIDPTSRPGVLDVAAFIRLARALDSLPSISRDA